MTEPNGPEPATPRGLEDSVADGKPRLGPDDTFRFSCDPGVSCFTCCCSDVNIFLTPYDVLRLKNRLGITSGEFLRRHALVPVQKEMTTPVVMLRMNDDELKTCSLLGEEGCSVYSDRPWPCRMYPLGLAAEKDAEDGHPGDRIYFLMEEEACKGFDEAHQEWTVREWTDDQEIDAWERWGATFKDVVLHDFFQDGGVLPPERMEMLFTACYDLDRFRDFVFESSLLERFEVDEDLVDAMRTDDEELLRFAFLWLRFSLFGEPTMRVKPSVAEAFEGRVKREGLQKKSEAARAAYAAGGTP